MNQKSFTTSHEELLACILSMTEEQQQKFLANPNVVAVMQEAKTNRSKTK